MPRIDRTGQRFGLLTVVSDDPTSTQLVCSCLCGREGAYPRSIAKPTYRGRTMCAWCAGSECTVCQTIIPAKPGRPAAACSEACAAEHVRQRGRQYYRRVKSSEHWMVARARYLLQLADRKEHDPQFAERLRFAHAQAVKRHADRVAANPERRAVLLERKRGLAKRSLDRLRESGKYPEYLAKHRAWYASLSDDQYQIIYGRERKSRTIKREPRP